MVTVHFHVINPDGTSIPSRASYNVQTITEAIALFLAEFNGINTDILGYEVKEA